MVILVWTVSAGAVAQDASSPLPNRAVLRLPACTDLPFDMVRLQAALRVELTTLGVAEMSVVASDWRVADGVVPMAIIGIDVPECGPSATVALLALVDAATAKTTERRMRIDDILLDSRPRALAIAIAELMQSSFAELWIERDDLRIVALPAAVREAVQARLTGSLSRKSAGRIRLMADVDTQVALALARSEAAREQRAAQRRERRQIARLRARVDMAAVGMLFSDGAAGLAGARVGGQWPLTESVRWGLGIEALGGVLDHADAFGPLGTITIGLFTLDAGLAVVSRSNPELQVGPRLQLGYGTASGTSDRPDVVAHEAGGVVVNAQIVALMHAAVSDSWSAHIGVAVGHVIRGLEFTANNGRATGVLGANLGLQAGLTYRP